MIPNGTSTGKMQCRSSILGGSVDISVSVLDQTLDNSQMTMQTGRMQCRSSILSRYVDIGLTEFHQILDNIKASMPAGQMQSCVAILIERVDIGFAKFHRILDGIKLATNCSPMQGCVSRLTGCVDIGAEREERSDLPASSIHCGDVETFVFTLHQQKQQTRHGDKVIDGDINVIRWSTTSEWTIWKMCVRLRN